MATTCITNGIRGRLLERIGRLLSSSTLRAGLMLLASNSKSEMAGGRHSREHAHGNRVEMKMCREGVMDVTRCHIRFFLRDIKICMRKFIQEM